MKITYINHSGFLIETRDCYYIFDYYKGELPHLDKEKEVIVFCSHFHEDHFNPQIFGILEDMGMTYQAVLANDIRKRNHLSDLKITYVYHDQTYNLDNGTEVDTLLSNDSGVAFIVKTKEGTIYHAGNSLLTILLKESPSIKGILISVINTSGFVLRIRGKAISPSAASPTKRYPN